MAGFNEGGSLCLCLSDKVEKEKKIASCKIRMTVAYGHRVFKEPGVWAKCFVCSVAQSCLTLCSPMEPSRLLCPWDFPGKNTGVGCHFFLQGISRTQGSNPHLLCLLHCRQVLHHGATWEAQLLYMCQRD